MIQLISSIVCLLLMASHSFGRRRPPRHVLSEYLLPNWLVHFPDEFLNDRKGGVLLDVKDNAKEMEIQREFIDTYLPPVDGYTDGELIDALEHFFWGKINGLSLELGALEGSNHTRSITYPFQKSLGWDRVLIEANPAYKKDMIKNSPKALSVNAAICNNPGKVHYVYNQYVGGIVEYMAPAYLKDYHKQLYEAQKPPGNISSINWSKVRNVREISCIPLSTIFHYFKISHINLFVLDTEGAEYEVLQSIDWSTIIFDVLCVETEPSNRPPGYDVKVTKYLEEQGYLNYTGQIGRNIWYVHHTFRPSLRPGLNRDCFNGWRKADHMDRLIYRKTKAQFKPCPYTSS